MQQRRVFSIKYKILALLTILPVLSLAVYLLVAIGIFEKDKVAYVFESSSAIARSLSAQARTELNSVLNAARPVIQEFIIKREFDVVSQAVLSSETQLDWIAAYSIEEGKYSQAQMSVVERVNGLSRREIQSFGNIEPLLVSADQKGRIIRVPYKDDRVLIVERVGSPSGKLKNIFLIMSRLPTLANSFRAPSGAETYLVNEDGFILFGPAGTEATYLSEKMNLEFLTKNSENNYSSGTEIVRSGKSEFLASYAKTSFGDISVVSLVDKDKALYAVQALIAKSLNFFVFLIALTTIISLFASSTVTSALTDLFVATKNVAEGKFDIRVKVNSSDEVGSLADSFNAMAAEVSRLLSETAEKARMEGELKTAQTVQETLFPNPTSEIGPVRIAGFYEPASECGGDWWHYCQIGTKAFIWIGDATGHGAPAALITSAAKSAATILERLNVDPAHALELMNRAIYDVSKGQLMMTFFLASIDLKTLEMTYSNASHDPPYLLKKKEESLKKRDLEPLLEANNPRLGQSRVNSFKQQKIQLNPGDRLFLYTDGVADIKNPSGETLGERNFIKLLLQSVDGYPVASESAETLASYIKEYKQDSDLIDDVTFVFVEIKS